MLTQNFKELHESELPLIIGNIWDVQSAKLAEKAGYLAVGTSSTAISNILGYEDGQMLAFDELLFFVERIVKHINIPLTVDMEAGYSLDSNQINQNIQQLIHLGVAGINIEDSLVENGKRSQVALETFAKSIANIRTFLEEKNSNLFINARIDSYLLGRTDALNDTIARVKAVDAAGTNGIFIPGIANSVDIKTIVETTSLPLNTYAIPGVPSYEELTKLGVKRISSGGALQVKTYAFAEELFTNIIDTHRFNILF